MPAGHRSFCSLQELPHASWPRAQGVSLGLHALLLALLLIPRMSPFNIEIPKRPPRLTYTGLPSEPLRAAGAEKEDRGGGSGGARQPEPPTAGRIPPFSWLQLAPPKLNPDASARLQVAATLVGDPRVTLPQPPLPNFGDPMRLQLTGSQGPGGGDGFGDGCCTVGPGDGPGFGPGGGGNLPQAGRRGMGTPVCEYCPNPSFTEEAIRVKYNGTVLLRVVVSAAGEATQVTVMRGAGMGLDEQAVQTVRTWKFRPARDPGGRPAATWVLVEVRFHQF
jgi:protein TonB